ncbi:class I SAM-dependent methyltransferase [Candidatus Pelagibacter sp.]|nr:class I SAM-dependent methyltransferase [Candidatus Pelagibacter sp.]
MIKNYIHNYESGKLEFCQICNSNDLETILDLGYQPLADDLRPIDQKNQKTNFYPLKINLCRKCIMLQTSSIVEDEILYPKNYHYTPGISKQVRDNFKSFVIKTASLYKLKSSDLILDIGCNDGSLLDQFKNFGFKNLFGIEPTDTVKIAKKNKHKILQSFFNKKSADNFLKLSRVPKIITTTNVFAHTGKLGEFIEGLLKIMNKETIFIVENHYLGSIISKNQFDSFYHEHLRTYSLTSLKKLLKIYGINLIDAYITSRYGGNIQAHFSLNKNLKPSKNVQLILDEEKKKYQNDLSVYKTFKNNISKNKNQLYEFLNKNKNKNIVGKSFPARASILIHHYDYLKDFINIVGEQNTSKKINHYIAGTNIKIVDSKLFKKDKPDLMIIFAWHMFEKIRDKWIKIGLNKTKYIKPLPKLKIF